MTATDRPMPDARVLTVEAVTDPSPSRQRLSRADCLVLLASGGRGRVAATMSAIPVILPVNFTLLAEDVVFSLGSGEGLARAVADRVVAFETDHVGSDGGAQWEVHVTGVATALLDERSTLAFRLSSEVITGWRVAGA